MMVFDLKLLWVLWASVDLWLWLIIDKRRSNSLESPRDQINIPAKQNKAKNLTLQHSKVLNQVQFQSKETHSSIFTSLVVLATSLCIASALGINCRGSTLCGRAKYRGLHRNTIIQAMRAKVEASGLADSTTYNSGDHIACDVTKVCLCGTCGSVPIHFVDQAGNNDARPGILTFNYVKHATCVGNCIYVPAATAKVYAVSEAAYDPGDVERMDGGVDGLSASQGARSTVWNLAGAPSTRSVSSPALGRRLWRSFGEGQ